MASLSPLYLFATFLCTLIVLQGLRPLAAKVGLLDLPGGRKTHIGATPLVGGLGIFFGLLLISLSLPAILQEFSSLLTLSALILFIGTIDDIKDLKPFVRMTGHVLVALTMSVVAGLQLYSLGDLVFTGNVITGWMAIPITVFATVGVINAVNMSDGIDGLSGGLVIVALVSIGTLAFFASDFGTTGFISLLTCSILAFLTMNFRRLVNKRALVYLGDAGSTMLGFILAWLMIESTQGEAARFAPVYALWFLALPLFDTVNLLFKRPMRGISPFKPGTDHLHHALLSRGYSEAQVVALLLLVSALFALTGMAGIYFNASESVMFALFLGLFIAYFLTVDLICANNTEAQEL